MFHDIYLPFRNDQYASSHHLPGVAGRSSCWGPGRFLYDDMIFLQIFLNITELYRLGTLRSCIMISGEGTHQEMKTQKYPTTIVSLCAAASLIFSRA